MSNEQLTPGIEEQDLTKAFETEVCGRCGGGGHYSYCQMHGTTCFGCSGKGKVYSKRANVALEYARTLRMVKVEEVQVGWLLWDGGGPFTRAGWFVVTEINPKSNSKFKDGEEWKHYYDLTTKNGVHGTFPESEVQAVPNRERMAEVKALALAFQATLTKTGKVATRPTRKTSPEKLEAARVKRESIRLEKQAEKQKELDALRLAQEAKQKEIEAEITRKAAERENARKEARSLSQYVGVIGDRMELTLTVEHVITLESMVYGRSWLHLCRDAEGNRVIYKGTGSFAAKGETVTVKATVKEHSEYKDEKQTKISRPKVVGLVEAGAGE